MKTNRQIQKQRCIGYQKLLHNKIASVIQNDYEDGTRDYYLSYNNDNGSSYSGMPTTERPHIDIPQEPRNV